MMNADGNLEQQLQTIKVSETISFFVLLNLAFLAKS
jgi:hypothetical protein